MAAKKSHFVNLSARNLIFVDQIFVRAIEVNCTHKVDVYPHANDRYYLIRGLKDPEDRKRNDKAWYAPELFSGIKRIVIRTGGDGELTYEEYPRKTMLQKVKDQKFGLQKLKDQKFGLQKLKEKFGPQKLKEKVEKVRTAEVEGEGRGDGRTAEVEGEGRGDGRTAEVEGGGREGKDRRKDKGEGRTAEVEEVAKTCAFEGSTSES
ncbi:hypothetical protein KC19_12G074200 [Ceratodon purpureus]|uniref:Uncharacterized protein n=1 Tax=Ceratodon purpureus TaxID=3225 RepID=A0A8T0G6Z6_CERPU|nr:hypothetical protein KC19_12G074200 [Ceratodon purpureus]